MNPNKITVRRDGTLWRVDCPDHDFVSSSWWLSRLAIESAFTHAERHHGAGKITVRRDGALWRVDCPHHSLGYGYRSWWLGRLAVENAFTHAERDHGAR